MALLAYDSADWATPSASLDDDAGAASEARIACARVASSVYGWRDGHRPSVAGNADSDAAIWQRINDHLVALQLKGRHALRVVEVGCGNGDWLLRTIVHARTLGFTAIEGHGIDASAESIATARRNAAALADPAIGVTFALGASTHLDETLALEVEAPADLILCLDTTLNILPPARRRDAARGLMAASTQLIARAAGGDAARPATAIDAGYAVVRDAAHDRLEIDMPDGMHITLPWHGFTAGELIALFAPFGEVTVDDRANDLLIMASARGA